MNERTYIAIDLKSFYASVECTDRGLDPLITHLVVADPERTEKTICLAVSPPLKAYGISGRSRLFEVVQKVTQINRERIQNAPNHLFVGSSASAVDLEKFPECSLEYIVAPPQMARYIEVSAKIYSIYLRFVAPEDVHVYSIDEVFIDITHYLKSSGKTARELAMEMILSIVEEVGITATAGIAPNLYLAKVAMDIGAKKIQPDKNGVRIVEMNENEYRTLLWNHRPLTDFWRVGRGYAKKLEENGLFTMGDIARCSIGKETEFYNENLLYKLFGINAELLIDHAWGVEPCTIADIKAYKPTTNSISSGQVLQEPYSFSQAKLIVWEMVDLLVLDLIEKQLVADQFVLTIGYDIANLQNEKEYKGTVTKDYYGRAVPKHAHGTKNLEAPSSSFKIISEAVLSLYENIMDSDLLVRRINVTANHVIPRTSFEQTAHYEQLDLFTDYEVRDLEKEEEKKELKREEKVQETILRIKQKYGKNAILRGTNLEKDATMKNRNNQIGGHRA